jgi:hypothetical protein
MRPRSIVKKLTPAALRPLAIAVYMRWQAWWFAVYRRLRRPSGRYLAVSEQNYITFFPPEWTSVDLTHGDINVNLEADYELGLTEVEYAYSGHTIEHLSDAAVRRLLGKLFKAMKPGGVVRIECPDLDMLLDDYKCVHNRDRKLTRRVLQLYEHMEKADPRYAQEHQKVMAGIVSYTDHKLQMGLTPLCSAEEFQRNIATMSNEQFGDWAVSLLTPENLRDSYLHRNWFNYDKLQRFLTAAGFSGVTRCEPGRTRHGFRMNINRTDRSWYSVFVEAIKPERPPPSSAGAPRAMA